MNVQSIAAVGVLAVIGGALQPSFAQDALDRATEPVLRNSRSLPPHPVVHSWNRASRIIGLQVENLQKQNLGRVDDVVFDISTGRVAYVVLAAPAPYGDRLIAVPPGALTPATDGSNQLVMDMDRIRLDNAPTFTQNDWPDVNHPFTGAEAFWGSALNPRWVAPAVAVRPPATPPTVVETVPPPATPPAVVETVPPPPVAPANQGTAPLYQGSTVTGTDRVDTRSSFRGRVVAVSPESRTMSVESDTGEVRTFVFSDRPNLQLKNNRNPRIVDIKVGFPVNVGYRVEPDGTLTAQTVIRTDTPEVK